MRLIVAEKPSVARTIAEAVGASSRRDGYLEGSGWIVTWCRGHLVDLDRPDAYPEWAGKWDVSKLPMIPTDWRWHVTEGSEEQYDVVASLMWRPDVECVYNACDADREGEGIFRRVSALTGLDLPVMRLWSVSLVADQVRRDIDAARPASDYDGLGRAAEGRAKADWLVGMNASRAYSALYNAHFSAGRVQTPTLALVVERTRAARDFKSVPFYQVVLDLGGFEVAGERMADKDAAQVLAGGLAGKAATVTSMERKRESAKPPRLYDLTGLQRDASDRAGLSAEDTLKALQSLYEAKLATYPRTESKFIAQSDLPMAERALSAVACEGVVGAAAVDALGRWGHDLARVVDDSKVHGHGAILPTELATPKALSGLSGAERTVMLLVCFRLVEAVMPPGARVRSKVIVACGGAEYAATGSTVVDPSWLAVDEALRSLVRGDGDEEAKDEAQAIPDGIAEGDSLTVLSARVREGKTTPPKPYTDATLLSAMEHAGRGIEDKDLKAAIEDDTSHSGGLGTPATRASTIEKLVEDGYVERKGRSLLATERGCALIDTVADSLKTPELTARWELELSRVEDGEATLDSFMKGIEGYTRQVVEDAKATFDPERKTVLSGAKKVGACPLCGSPVVRKGGVFTCSSNRFSGPSDGYKLLEGCGFRLFAKQCKKELTDKQAERILAGETVRLKGLKRKDGSDFDADVLLGDPPYEGRVKFAPRKERRDGGTSGKKGRPSRGRSRR